MARYEVPTLVRSTLPRPGFSMMLRVGDSARPSLRTHFALPLASPVRSVPPRLILRGVLRTVLPMALLVTVALGAPGSLGAQGASGAAAPTVPSGSGGTVHLRDALAASRALPLQGERLLRAREIEREARDFLANQPDDPDLLWWTIAAMAFQVDEESNVGKVNRTRDIYDEVLRLRALAPEHPGGEHALGRLHAGVMRLNPVLRFVAVRLVGGDVLRGASWESAEAHFRRALELEPDAVQHRLELALILIDRDRRAEALALLDGVQAVPARDPMDAIYRARAIAILEGR